MRITFEQIEAAARGLGIEIPMRDVSEIRIEPERVTVYAFEATRRVGEVLESIVLNKVQYRVGAQLSCSCGCGDTAPAEQVTA